MRWAEPPPRDFTGNDLGLHPFVRSLLAERGMTSKDEIASFIDPDLYRPTPGIEIPGLASCVDKIESALRRNELICIWGDFDADGQTATTVLVQTLRGLGGNVTYHIPVRANESHGVNIPNLKMVIDQGVTLVITCDTGISANDAVEYANSRNVDFMITDHHDLPDTIPNAIGITNPKMLPSGHPLSNLAGVGVAYKVAEELLQQRKAVLQSNSLLDLVALGMVADLAILTRDSRYLVQKGLECLNKTERLGIKVMMELSEIDSSNVNEEHIGFTLGPRLNALGRLGDANPAVELLTTSDPVRCRILATQLEGLNAQRKLLCDQVIQAAELQLRENPSLLAKPIIILSHPSWPGGVVGIAASKLVERYGKPAILFSTPANEPARGSARSIDGFNITEAIASQRDILFSFGGHPMAAGLSLDPEKLPEFRRKLAKVSESLLGEGALEEKPLFIDGWINLEDASLEFSEAIETLAPFGPGNRKPILAARNLAVIKKNEIGKNKEHLKITVESERGVQRDVLWWDGANEEIPEGRFDLAFSLRASTWQGARRNQIVWIDARPLDSKPIRVDSVSPEVVDFRRKEDQLEMLKALPEGTKVWAEGPGRKKANGVDRLNLPPSKILAIWTPPPSREVLQQVMENVHPEKVFLFSVDPGMDDAQGLLERLGGLIKFTLTHKDGQTYISELAAACAQTEIVIQKGLDWLVEHGQVKIEYLTSDSIKINHQAGSKKSEKTDLRIAEIQALLQETSSYRKYFSAADTKSLFP
jgi:single-stranded-DNA-specific exonuclease